MMFTKIAILNMLKHGRRTILILIAVILSVMVMELIGGMLQGIEDNFYLTIVEQTGHLQIHGEGWRDRLDHLSIEHTIANPRRIIDEIRKEERVNLAEPILHFGGLLVTKEKNIGMAGIGILRDSGFFPHIRERITEGRFFEDENEILLSNSTALLLELNIGDGVIVLVENSEGSPYYLEYTIAGLFQTDSREFDNTTFFIQHESAENLVFLENRSIEIRITLEDREEAEEFKGDLIDVFQGGNSEDYLLEIETWKDINGSVILLFEVFDILMIMINVFVIIIAATVITNAILMNVFERIREFGTMRAIGLKRGQLFGIIILEGTILGMLGSLLGLALGIPVVLYFEKHGLNMGAIGEIFKMGDVFRFAFAFKNSLINALSGILIAILGSTYAGIIGSRLKIMESLHYK